MRAILRRLAPLALRILIRNWQIRLMLPPAGPRPDGGAAGRVTVVGYLTAPTGLGEGARLCARALAEMGLTVGLLDVTDLMRVPGGATLPTDYPGLVAGDAGGPLIVHVNPPAMAAALWHLGVSGRARPVFAHWVWELPHVGRDWQRAFRLVHEVWVPSPFVAEALRASGCAVPIRLVPYPVAIDAEARPSRRARAQGRFTVLAMFAFASGFERKNPLGAIAAFRQAFGAREDVVLVLKTLGASLSGEPERRLRAAIADARNVEVVEATLDAAAVDALVARADVLLSMHRAEGYGLPLAAAMLRGKPVVATAWSGNLGFMTPETACLVPAGTVAAHDETALYAGVAARWADPSVDAAAAWLRRLEADPTLRQAIGTAAASHMRECGGVAAYAAAVRPALEPAQPGPG